MLRARWRNPFRPPLVPPAVVLGTAVLISLAAAQMTAAAQFVRPSAAVDCTAPDLAKKAAGRHIGAPPAIADKLDERGEFIGRALAINAQGGPVALNLPVESSVSQPQGDALVYTQSVGPLSEVHVVDLGTGCDALIVRTVGVVRSAILDATGTNVYVHGVTFPARDDAGVTRYSLDGRPSAQVVPPVPYDDRFGLTFSTQLGWNTDGSKLSVQSCGAQACRTRLLDTVSGAIATFDAAGQGQIIGVTGAHLVTYADCAGLPCQVLSTDLGSGTTTVLADEAWSANIATTADGDTVVRIETAAGTIEVAQ